MRSRGRKRRKRFNKIDVGGHDDVGHHGGVDGDDGGGHGDVGVKIVRN